MTASINRRDFIKAGVIAAAVPTVSGAKGQIEPMIVSQSNYPAPRTRQVHLDFHTSEFIPGIGEAFNKQQWQGALRAGHVNHINIFAKCHQCAVLHDQAVRPVEEAKPRLGATRALARRNQRVRDAFVRLWSKWGQFGQFVDIDTGNVRVGGSTSPAIACAGLALASIYFKDDRYLKVAEAAAEAYCAHDLRTGITTGGPLEIAQAADCESSYGLFESLMVLYEITGDRRWLDRAINAGSLFATWIVSYDYRFPPQSKYGRLGMRTLGTMFASAQNKCAVPGICSHSGSSLLKLYRATGNVLYLNLITEIAHSLTQYASPEDWPIEPLWPGAMNERIEMGDWLEPIGEILDCSSWPRLRTCSHTSRCVASMSTRIQDSFALSIT